MTQKDSEKEGTQTSQQSTEPSHHPQVRERKLCAFLFLHMPLISYFLVLTYLT